MIKQFLLPGLLIFLLGSCKKKYTCVCTTTIVFQSSATGNLVTITPAGNNIEYSEKLTEKQAKAACKHEETAIQTDLNNWNTDYGAYVYKPGEYISTFCGIH